MLRRSFRALLPQTTTATATKHYDVAIIGGGPAGIAAAMRATDFGKGKVCVVEAGRVGGKDVWNGTMHSKALWEISKISAQCRGSSFRRCFEMDEPQASRKDSRYNVDGSSHVDIPKDCRVEGGHGDAMQFVPSSLYGAFKPDYCVTRRTIDAMCRRREEQILTQLSSARIDLIKGKATFASPHELNVYREDGSFEPLRADYFVIATGSRPRRPPQFKADGVSIVNSEQILNMPFPSSLLVIGAGAQGAEWGSIFANLGTTKVSLLERDSQILPRTDADILSNVKNLFAKKNVRMFEGYHLETLRVEDNVVRYAARNTVTGHIHNDTVEKALICMGRTPNYEALGLSALSGSVVQNGRIKCDRFGRCIPYRHIYVAGDASGGKTVRTAETQGRSVVEHMFEFRPQSGDRFSETHETQIMFLDQEVATCGWSERKCRERSVAYRVATYSYKYVARALAMNNTKGFVKIIVTKDRQQKVLGVSAVGAHASSIVEIASAAVMEKRQICEFDALFAAYPSVASCFEQCARMLRGHSMLKPGKHAGIELRSWTPVKPRGRGYVASEVEPALMSVTDMADGSVAS